MKKQVFLVIFTVMAMTALSTNSYSQDQPSSGPLRERIIERLKERRASDNRAQMRSDSKDIPQDYKHETLTHKGAQRSYYIYVPRKLPPNPGVVFILHGGGGNAQRSMSMAPLDKQANLLGFIAVYPEADDDHLWNDGRVATAQNGDDVDFILEIINSLHKTYSVDKTRIFATGISNGGMFSYKLACDAQGTFAAIAPVAANMPDELVSHCAPASGLPIMILHGTDDQLMPYDGGQPKAKKFIERHRGELTDTFTGAEKTLAIWAKLNGCRDNQTTRSLPDRHDDHTTVTLIKYAGCKNETSLYSIKGGGHNWPGGNASHTRISGYTSQEIDATKLIVQFFRENGL